MYNCFRLGIGLRVWAIIIMINIISMSRNSKTTEFIKSIAISENDLKYIDDTKVKKSKAGKLKEIIAFYKTNKNL